MQEQYLNKQQLEMGGLLKRIQSGREDCARDQHSNSTILTLVGHHEEQKLARRFELERLLQRYNNVIGSDS
eukprot:1300352-Amphidinium_carterae.2